MESRRKKEKVVSEGDRKLNIPSNVVGNENVYVPPPEIDPSKAIVETEKEKEKIPEIRRFVERVVQNRLKIEGLTEEEKEKIDPEILQSQEEGETQLQYLLWEERSTLLRRTAWETLFLTLLKRPIQNKQDIYDLLSRLVSQKLLVPNPKGRGKLKINSLTYDFPEKSSFLEENIEKIQEALNDLVLEAQKREKMFWQEENRRLKNLGELSPTEFLEGKPGNIFLRVPAEYDENEKRWRSGGALVVRSDGENVYILPDPQDPSSAAACGRIKKGLIETMRQGIFLRLVTLTQKDPPFLKIPAGHTTESYRRKVLQMGRKIRFLWHIVKRGLNLALKEEEIEKNKQKLQEKSEIDSREFFLEKKEGVCFVEFEGRWKCPDETEVPNLFLLVRRKIKEGESLISLVETPSHLVDFFKGCEGEYEEGERFKGLPQPLQAVLKAIYGQTVKKDEISKMKSTDGKK